jgi:hypothetical protein
MAYFTHERKEMCAWFWYEKLKERNYVEDLGVEGRMILKCF